MCIYICIVSFTLTATLKKDRYNSHSYDKFKKRRWTKKKLISLMKERTNWESNWLVVEKKFIIYIDSIHVIQ